MRIAASALAIGYPGHSVARDITLDAGLGDVLCLLGPNGSGKTTLFKTLLGLLPTQGGAVHVDGHPLTSMRRRDVARYLAYVPQADVASFAFTASEIVLMGRTAHLGAFAQPSAGDHEIARMALDRLGIGDLANNDYTRLSGGQRQLVLIARALAQDVPILVMDEPTASLDFGNQLRVLKEIMRLADDGFCVILSTHNPDHALAIGTSVLLLHQGQVLASGLPFDALTPATLSRVYGIDVSIERLTDGRRICMPPIAAQGDNQRTVPSSDTS